MEKINEETIKTNSVKLYAMLNEEEPYTFVQLQTLSHLDNTDLCMALIQLIRENQIEQKNEEGIYYLKIVPKGK